MQKINIRDVTESATVSPKGKFGRANKDISIADNPVGESCYYPDSKKWFINAQCRQIVRSDSLDYFDGEE